MKVGFLGLPGSGKTTLFNLVTGREVDPGLAGRAEALMGVVTVPDERLPRIAEIYGSDRAVPPEVTFVDLMALHRGEGKQRARDESLTKVAGDADAFALVLQCFGEMDYEGNPLDPAADLETLLLEMTITDLAVVERRLERIGAEMKAARDKTNPERDLLQRVADHLVEGNRVIDMELTGEDERTLRGFNLLTAKPLLVVFNVGEDDLQAAECGLARQHADSLGLPQVAICGPLEQELAELDEATSRELLEDYGLEAPARDRFIRACYQLLDVITYFTANENEAHGWTIPAGAIAREAAGKVHSDMYDGFIRAEVIPFEKLNELGSVAACKEAGAVRLEGRDYVVQDGDILDVRFSR